MLIKLLGQICRMFIEPCLPTYTDGRIQIKRQFSFPSASPSSWRRRRRTSGLSTNELVEKCSVGCLGVAVEKECSVVGIGETARVKFLQIGREVMNSLCIEELPSCQIFIHNESER